MKRALPIALLLLAAFLTWVYLDTGHPLTETARAPAAPNTTPAHAPLAPEAPRGPSGAGLDVEQRTPIGEVAVADTTPRPILTVRVEFEGDARPAAGAAVWIEREDLPEAAIRAAAERYSSDVAELEHDLGRELELDADAMVRTESPRKAVRVAARLGSFACSEVVARDETACLLRLRPSHDLDIRVFDSTGAPCRGVHVALGYQPGPVTVEWVPVDGSRPRPASFDEVPADVRARLAELGTSIEWLDTPRSAVSGSRIRWIDTTDARGRCRLYGLESRVEPAEGESYWWIAPVLADSTPERYRIDLEHLPASPITFQLGPSGRLTLELRDSRGRLVDDEGSVRLRRETDAVTIGSRVELFPTAPLRGGRAVFENVGAGLRFRASCIAVDSSGSWVQVVGPEQAGARAVAAIRAVD